MIAVAGDIAASRLRICDEAAEAMTNIEKQLRFLRVYSITTTLVLAAAIVWVAVRLDPRRMHEIAVSASTW